MAFSLTFLLILLLACSLEGEACIPGILSSSPLKVGVKVVHHYAQIDGFLIRQHQGLLPTEPPSQPPAPPCFE